jgi:hypothetical protein
LLVEPISDGAQPDFKPIQTHAGGIVWYGDFLYVTAAQDLLVFRMSDLMDLHAQPSSVGAAELRARASSTTLRDAMEHDREDAPTTRYGRRKSGRYTAGDFRYILPLLGRYELSDDSAYKSHFDSLGLDRSTDPPRLVSARWRKSASELGKTIICFWDLDSDVGRSRWEAACVVLSNELYIQGIHARGTTVWLFLSEQGDIHRLLRREIDGSFWQESSWNWPRYGECLTYAPQSDHLWNVLEEPGNRVCFCIHRSDIE